MNSHKQTIAVLDSGVGGLSIVHSIRTIAPHFSIIYGCDNKNFPYGPKPPEKVTQCVTQITEQIINRFSPNLIVIACNTASTVALETLRDLTSTPIIGVVPAIKPAALKSKSKVIGLLATPGTVQRSYTQNLIREHASHCRVIKIGSTRLVEIAEEKLRQKKVNLEEIKQEISPFFNSNTEAQLDTIVLGCTHFPLLLEEFKAVVPYPIQWVDSSEAIANRVTTLAQHGKVPSPSFTAAFSELNDYAKALTPYLSNLGFSHIVELK